MILTQALNNASVKDPSRIAVLDLGEGVTFAELRKRVGQLSYLHLAEIGHGKKVAFLSQNTLAVVQTFLAFSNIGILSIFLNPKDDNEKILQCLKDLEITHICVSGDQVSRMNELMRVHNVNFTLVDIEKKKGGEYDPSFTASPDHPLKETDTILAVQVLDIGEEPKYIFFNHKQIYSAVTSIRKFYHLGANDRFFTTMSWSHPFALIHSMLLPILSGSTCAVDPQQAKAEDFVEYLAKYQINRFVDHSKYFYQLLTICKNTKFTLPGVKSITVGMSILPKGLRKTFSLLKIPVLHCYGRCENLWTIGMQDLEHKATGRNQIFGCLPGIKYKVVDAAGDEIPANQLREGPLAITGDAMMTTFYHPNKAYAEKASKLTIRGGWFYTGEIARLETDEKKEQSVTILGRLSEVIAQEKTFLCADRLDEIAKEIPEVLDAAGFVFITRKGEQRLACAVVRQGKTLTESEVLKHCVARLAKNLHPASVHLIQEIPYDEFGNVQRFLLQRQLSET